MPRLWALTLISTTSARSLAALGVELADACPAAGRDDAGVEGRPAGHHLADRQRVVRRLAAQLAQHRAGHRHVRRAADQQDAVDLVPRQAPPAAAPAASSAGCGISRSRVRFSNSSRLSGTASLRPAWCR